MVGWLALLTGHERPSPTSMPGHGSRGPGIGSKWTLDLLGEGGEGGHVEPFGAQAEVDPGRPAQGLDPGRVQPQAAQGVAQGLAALAEGDVDHPAGSIPAAAGCFRRDTSSSTESTCGSGRNTRRLTGARMRAVAWAASLTLGAP
jgi:hypothetical protein